MKPLAELVPDEIPEGMPLPTRPWTPNTVTLDDRGRKLVRTIGVKRCCNGCRRQIGDVTRQELDCAMLGLPLPDVRSECGCE